MLVVAACSILTDLLLVVFPIPILIQSRIKLKRKVLLVSLFCLGLCTVCITLYRVPNILSERGYQGTRTMWASVEILVATFVNNAIALGTFVRDTGPKKKKFKQYISPADAYARDKKTGGGSRNMTTTLASIAERTVNDKRGSMMMGTNYSVSAAQGSDDKAGIIIRTDTVGSSGTTLSSTSTPTHNRNHTQEELARDSVASSNGHGHHLHTGSEGGHNMKPRERDSQESLIPKPDGHTLYFGTVMKTTEISVTVTDANEEDLRAQHDGGRIPQVPPYSHHHHHYDHHHHHYEEIIIEAPRIVTAGDRGVQRGTTKLLGRLPAGNPAGGKEEDSG